VVVVGVEEQLEFVAEMRINVDVSGDWVAN
jgi:hypothetical protein